MMSDLRDYFLYVYSNNHKATQMKLPPLIWYVI